MSSSQISSSSETPLPGPPRAEPSRPHPLAGMLDVPCTVDVIVGDGSITVRDCLKLKRQSVIRLRQAAGSALAVHVHDVPIASGEIVVIDDRTALRISAITPPPGVEAPA